MWMIYRIENNRQGDLIAFLRSFRDGDVFPRGKAVPLRVLELIRERYREWVAVGSGLGRVIVRPLTPGNGSGSARRIPPGWPGWTPRARASRRRTRSNAW